MMDRNAVIKKVTQKLWYDRSMALREELINLFKRTPYPKDLQLRDFASRFNMEKDELKTEVYKLLSDFIWGRVFKHWNVSDDQFDPKELAMGIEVEQEHINDPIIAKAIAKAHLMEISDYYTRLKKMEDEAGNKTASKKYIFKMAVISKKSLSDPQQYKTPAKLTGEEALAAIRQSIIAEMDAINLYEALKASSTNEEFKDLLDHIIQEEKEHSAELLVYLHKVDPEQQDAFKEEEALEEKEDIILADRRKYVEDGRNEYVPPKVKPPRQDCRNKHKRIIDDEVALRDKRELDKDLKLSEISAKILEKIKE